MGRPDIQNFFFWNSILFGTKTFFLTRYIHLTQKCFFLEQYIIRDESFFFGTEHNSGRKLFLTRYIHLTQKLFFSVWGLTPRVSHYVRLPTPHPFNQSLVAEVPRGAMSLPLLIYRLKKKKHAQRVCVIVKLKPLPLGTTGTRIFMQKS